MNERTLIGGGNLGLHARDVIRLAQEQGVAGDPRLRQKLVDLYIRGETLRYMSFRQRSDVAAGRPLGPESAVAKLINGKRGSDLTELALEVLGAGGMLADTDAPGNGDWASDFLSSLASRIGGGTDEMQRNMIAEQILGLPREPAADRGVSFRELAARKVEHGQR